MTIQTIYNFTVSGNYTFNAAKIEVTGGKAQLINIETPTTQTYNFTDGTGLTYDSNKIEFVASKAQLKLTDNPGQDFTEDFASDTGFTYDSNYAEFVNVTAFSNATFAANYKWNLNGSWGDGVLTGTATGGAYSTNGNLNLIFGDIRFVSYAALNNANSQQTGCIRLKYTPNYSGTPASTMVIFAINESTILNNNELTLYHQSGTGELRFNQRDAAGTSQAGAGAVWNPTSGVEYEIEFNYDITTGNCRVFVDGTLLVADLVTTGTRSSAINHFVIGTNWQESTVSNFSIRDVLVFSTVQHTADYTSGYTVYDTNLTFEGVRQKDKRPYNSTCWSTYTTDINLNYGDGVLTGTAVGGATITGNKLDCTGGGKYVEYSATSNAELAQVGCIKMKYTPNYNGSPGANRTLVSLSETAISTNNLFYLQHVSAGQVFLTIWSSAGALITSSNLGAWNPTSGTEYEFEVNINITTGASRVFINGVQQGATVVATGLRSNNINFLRIGANYNATETSNGYYSDVVIFNSPQHTSNYTPGYTLTEKRYVNNNVIMPEMEYTGTGTLVSFDNLTTTESNTPKYTLQIARSGNYLYWDGGAWSTSDGTYAQATDKATFIANEATLPVNGEIYGQFKIHFTDSSLQANVAELTASLTAQIYPTDNPTIEINSAIIATVTTEPVTAWNTFAGTLSALGSDTITFVLSDDDGVTYKYWDSAAWSVSDNTVAQSNSVTDVNTNIGTFPKTTDGMKIKILFHSDTGQTTPDIDVLTVNYDDYIYATDDPTITPVVTFSTEDITAFTATVTEVGSDTVTFTIEVDGVQKYFSGTWVTSNETVAQTNTAAIINTNVSSLDLSTGVSARPVVYLHSNDGTTTPNIDIMTINYDYFNPAPTDPATCVVNNYLKDANNQAMVGVTIEVTPSNSDYISNKNLYIIEEPITTTTRSTGYWELTLIRSSEYDQEVTYDFKFTPSSGKAYYVKNKLIPNSDTIDFDEL